MAKNINIQDGFLFQSLKESRPLSVVLVTGKTLNNVTIKRFDRFAVVLAVQSQELLVYKHAIVLIRDVEGVPTRERRPPVVGTDRRSRPGQWG